MKNPRLTYCTNVHPLGDFSAWERTMGLFGPAIRAQLGWPNLPMGMWFPSALIEEIDRDPVAARARIQSLLARHKLETFTFNAFPFGNFHDKVVKTKVYSPDWTEASRLQYTVACAHLLADLLPAGGDGSVSTLPLGWRIGWSEDKTDRAAKRLVTFALEALEIAKREGKSIRLGIEPEPGCVLETTSQVLAFWDDFLRPAAEAAGLSMAELDAHVGLCYDTCHQAVQFEDPVEVLDRLAAAGIPLAKMQLSSALEFLPDPTRRSEALRGQFCEERFLHQVRIKTPDYVIHFDDLPDALEIAASQPLPERGRATVGDAATDIDLWAHPWRVHFHVPIDAPGLLDPSRIATTRDDMVKAYRHARAKDLCRHFEVETYTWSVMPEAFRPANDAALAECIAREIRFIESLEGAGSAVSGSAGAGASGVGA